MLSDAVLIMRRPKLAKQAKDPSSNFRSRQNIGVVNTAAVPSQPEPKLSFQLQKDSSIVEAFDKLLIEQEVMCAFNTVMLGNIIQLTKFNKLVEYGPESRISVASHHLDNSALPETLALDNHVPLQLKKIKVHLKKAAGQTPANDRSLRGYTNTTGFKSSNNKNSSVMDFHKQDSFYGLSKLSPIARWSPSTKAMSQETLAQVPSFKKVIELKQLEEPHVQLEQPSLSQIDSPAFLSEFMARIDQKNDSNSRNQLNSKTAIPDGTFFINQKNGGFNITDFKDCTVDLSGKIIKLPPRKLKFDKPIISQAVYSNQCEGRAFFPGPS